MPEISHIRLSAPDQASLNRVLREGGAQSFPQWLYAEPGAELRILWWGLRGAIEPVATPDDGRAGLFPRPVDDWTDAPRAVVLATASLDRAVTDLEPLIGADWHDVGPDPVLAATCRRMTLGRGILVLAEPAEEGYAAECLAQYGEGPVAVAVDGTTTTGRAVTDNPVTDGPASWVRLGPGPAPYFLFLPAG
ncbi:MAG TPA: hypothetical protein VFH90_10145 [Candidatus Limnocylindria bacterium]|nr:hypothetical protein [Candidatus Limnocylindria bacterium]